MCVVCVSPCVSVCPDSHQPLCPSMLLIFTKDRIPKAKTHQDWKYTESHSRHKSHSKHQKKNKQLRHKTTRRHPRRHDLSFAEFLTSMDSWAPTWKANLSSKKQVIRSSGHPIFSYLGVSKNSGTPKSSILIGFSIINRPFLEVFPLFLETSILSH